MRIFISYNNRDRAEAERLTAALEASLPGFDAYFAPRSNIGGSYWLPRLGEELQESDGLLLLLGSRIGSWQELEYYEALRLTRARGAPRIVPVLLGEDSPGLHFLSQFHRLRLPRQPYDALVEQVVSALGGAGVGQDTSPLWRETNPYRGLQAMGSANAAHFFGREALTGEILDVLRTLPDRVLALVGNSGVGKSSIVEAGVIAALRSRIWPGDMDRPWPADLDDSRSWLSLTIRPGEHPLRALALGFARTWIDDPADAEAQAMKWVTNFQNGSHLSALAEAARDRIADRTEAGPPSQILLYVDQGEELYARSEVQEAARFSELLAQAAGDKGIRVMTSLRADYYGRLQDDTALFPACDRLDIPPLDRTGIEAVIRKPAGRLGVRFEDPGIVPVIAETTARQSGALPLLSFMMSEAWEAMRRDEDSNGVLRFPIGVIDVAGPLVRRADQFLGRHPDGRDALRRLFTLRLAHVPKEGEPVRRRAKRAECDDREWALAQTLASADWRLLTTGADANNPTVEVAHETLLRSWPRLTGWIDDERAFLIWKGQLEADRLEWEAAPEDRRDEAVLMGLALDTARRWHAERRGDLAPRDRAFIERSLDLNQMRKDKEKKQQDDLAAADRRTARIRLWLMRGAVVASVLFAVLLVGVGWQWWQATTQLFETQKEQTRSRNATADRLLGENLPDAALAVAVAAFPEKAPHLWQELNRASGISKTLMKAYHGSRLMGTFKGHEDRVLSAAFSPDGLRIVTASADRTARVWDAASGAELLTLAGYELGVLSAAFSPDGTRIVTASADGTVRVGDAASGAALLALAGPGYWVLSAAFSPDGTRIVTASADRTARVWDAASGAELLTLAGHAGKALSAAFTPDGTRIVTASDDQTARVWDAASGAELLTLAGHEGAVTNAAFSPDGTRIVTVSADQTARVWDAASGAELLVLAEHEGAVTNAAFSPDGLRIVTASGDRTARVWDAASGAELLVLTGHEGWVTNAAFSPDGLRIVTASSDGTARLWDAASGPELLVLAGHEGAVTNAAFSPDGTRIVTVLADQTARVWDAASGAELLTLAGHEGAVTNAAFSPDGTRIVTVSADQTARVWDAASGAELLVLAEHEGAVTNAAFSPDGLRIVTASGDRTARVWDAASGAELLVLTGHEGWVTNAAFSPDGLRIVTASSDGTARLWDAASGPELLVLAGHEGAVTNAAFSPDGTRIVTVLADQTARVWDAASGAELLTLAGHEGAVTNAAFSPDGTRIVTVSADQTARVWDAASGAELLVLAEHEGAVTNAAFSPDGLRIVTASGDRTARVWDAASGAELLVLTGHEGWVTNAAFSPDGLRIVTASSDGTARLWDAPLLPELISLARAKVERGKLLTPKDECAYFLRSEGCDP